MMAGCQSFQAEQDWGRFMTIFNRCTVFAPYTIPLTEDLFDRFVLPFVQLHRTLARIAFNDSGEGIIHAGIHSYNGVPVGHIFMLFAENNEVANRLLGDTEAWFQAQGITQIFAFWWFPNPYNFILHGRETYAWAGAYPTNNAFRRYGYDLLNDIVIMQLHMNDLPALFMPNLPDMRIRRIDLDETDLAWGARVEAYVGDQKIGHCEFFDLKAISRHFHRSMGQITIDTKPAFHGEGVAKALITYAHQVLYQRGNRHVMLATGQGLFRAIKFYEKLGYKAELIRAYSYIKDKL